TRTGGRSPLRGAPRPLLASLLVFVIDFPDALLHEALHHRVETYAALLRLRDAEHRLRRGAHFHLLLGVALRDLLGRLGVDDLVAHADEPDTGRFARVHRSDRRAPDRGY